VSPLGLFEGFGVELEFMVVDAETLSVLPVVDRILGSVAGSIVSEVDMGPLAWSNELVLHVVELKTNGPASTLHGLDALFQADVQRINEILQGMGGILLPTAMHPWMDPRTETTLWPHEYSPIYQSYDRIFGCQGHGWSNLQSTHLNLPFGSDAEFGRLHAAIRLLLPLLPALAASSPLVEGRPTGLLDNRMEFYRHNSRRVPSVTAQVIPEPVFRREEYEREVLSRMYADVAPLDPDGILQDEFLNSRGAIPRFGRGSIEIRVIDVQESPVADLALAALAVGALRLLAEERLSPLSRQQGMPVPELASVFLNCIRDGERAVVEDADYLHALGMVTKRASAGEIWWHLLEETADAGLLPQEGQEVRLRALLRRGPLARQILRALELPESREQENPPPPPSRAKLTEVYRSLATCLQHGEIFAV
jgi:gamma-glutamyl:cysteine ligase YbdK (ATP-grasp superfamily)